MTRLQPEPARSGAFPRLVASNLAAQSAEQIALAAAPLVAVLALGAGVAGASLLQMVLTLPFVLFAIPAGLLADRVPRGRLMAAAEAVRALALLALLGLTLSGALTGPLLAALGFVSVCGTVAFSVAAPALVPSLVPESDLGRANARIELARTVAYTAGPALGGWLVGQTGAAAAFAVAAGLSVAAAVLLVAIPEPPRAGQVRRRPLVEMREGVAFVLRHPLLRPILATQFVFNIGFFLVMAVFAPYGLTRLGMSAQGVGLSLSLYGLGTVTGALAAPRLLRRLRFGTVVALGPVTGFAASLLLAATAIWPSAALAAFSLFMFGAGPILWVIATTTLRQAVTPPALLGRVSAVNIMTYGARPLGAGLAALIGAAFGAELCLVAASLLFLLQAAIILASPAARLLERPSGDMADASLDLRPDSAPATRAVLSV